MIFAFFRKLCDFKITYLSPKSFQSQLIMNDLSIKFFNCICGMSVIVFWQVTLYVVAIQNFMR